MIKNYLKIAFRNLWRHKAFSFINIMGLTVGMAACFLIFLYVKFETSYDNFNSKANRTYRMVCDLKTPTDLMKPSGPAWAVAPNLAPEFPEIEAAVRVSGESFLVRKDNIKFQEENSLMADSAFFTIFDYKLIKGNRATALKEPFSVVLSESTAKKYFGTADAMGQVLLFTGDNASVTVTGIMQDMPENSQIKGDLILSMATLTKKWYPDIDKQWGNYGSLTYVLLKPGTNATALEKKFPAFLKKRNGDEMTKMQMFPTLILEPLLDVYLRSTRGGNSTGNITNVYVFSVIAIFILLIACINFVNLATARSAERAKEVGIRKVVGAAKTQLASQFLGESVIICLIAFFLAVVLAAILLPGFNNLAGKQISAGIFSNAFYLLLLFLTALAIGLLAGLYPALVLSSFKPIAVLKGRFTTGNKGAFLRKSMVVGQFTISIALIISTIVVYRQMTFMRDRDLGFNKDQTVVLNTNGDAAKKTLKESLAGLTGVKSIASASSVPGGGNPGAYSEIENKKGDLQIANLDLYFVDFDYISQMGIKMVAGRGFDRQFGTDTTQAMVLNETAIKNFGYASPAEAIGKRFKQWGREGKIIGVMKDFHFRSLQETIKPLSMRIEPDRCDLVIVKVTGGNIPNTIASIENKWKTLIPNRPFSYYFLDEFFDRQYRAEERFGKLFLDFAILAIFISCLGLLGLASYSTMQRTKEIGIRKVMGSSVQGIIGLLSKDFLKLVIISFVIATPIAIYGMHGWLKDFAYRTDISWWIFLLAGVLALTIALLTISIQAFKAAIANPIKSLRTE